MKTDIHLNGTSYTKVRAYWAAKAVYDEVYAGKWLERAFEMITNDFKFNGVEFYRESKIFDKPDSIGMKFRKSVYHNDIMDDDLFRMIINNRK